LIFFPVSDDRSIELFRTRLETATQMQEVLSKDYRPNCLLIDEIDGAPAVIDSFIFTHFSIPFDENLASL
jgi:chromosome transmission fidelity protein 18